jgi:glutathione peroxidase
MSDTIHDIAATRIDGTPASLGEYAGKVLLIVNVASKCGFTPQYEALEKLYEAQRDRGLEILGFPANDFGAQEPGTNDEVATFCSTTYGVQFPLFEKISVKGDAAHPLYQRMVAQQPVAQQADDFRAQLAGYGIVAERPDDVMWNFEKFLVARDGRVVARFSSSVTPDDPALAGAIETELAKAQ